MSQNAVDREQSRKDGFKQGICDDDGIRKRTEFATQIRKEKRENKLKKMRQRQLVLDNPFKGKSLEKSKNMLPVCMNQIFSNDLVVVLKGLSGLAMFSCSTNENILRQISGKRIRARLVHIASAKKEDYSKHANAALGIIANLLYGLKITEMFLEETNIASVALDIMKNQKSSLKLKDSAMWVIANIISDKNTKYRDAFIESGAVEAICQNLKMILKRNPLSESAIEFRDTLLWAVSSCYDGNERPNFKIIERSGTSKLIIHCLLTMEDDAIIYPCLLSLHSATRYSDIQKSVLLNSNLVGRICKLVEHPIYIIQFKALQILGHLAAYPETETGNFSAGDILIAYGVINAILFSLEHSSSALKEEGTFIVSNLTSGLSKHIYVLWEKNIMQIVIENAFKEVVRIRNESIRCITNAFRTSFELHDNNERLTAVNRLLSYNTLKILDWALRSANGDVALDAINCCWDMAKTMKTSILDNFEESGISETIIELSMAATNSSVSLRAEELQEYLDTMSANEHTDEIYEDFLLESGDTSNFMQVAQKGNWGCDHLFQTDTETSKQEFSESNMEMDVDLDDNDNDNNNNDYCEQNARNYFFAGVSNNCQW